MILTHESGSQEDQFDEKNKGKKSRETIPLNYNMQPPRTTHTVDTRANLKPPVASQICMSYVQDAWVLMQFIMQHFVLQTFSPAVSFVKVETEDIQ